MNKHTVYIAGKRYVLLSDDANEYVTALADEVNEAIKTIAAELPTLEARSCAVLCALNYADEKYKQIERNKSLSGNAKTVMNQADKQSRQLRELKEKLQRSEETVRMLNNHNMELEQKCAELTEKRDALSDLAERLTIQLNDAQKKLESLPDETPGQDTKTEKGYIPTRQISLFDNEKN